MGDTMVRGQLRQSQDMDIMVMAMDMGMAMDMLMDIMDTMARDLLMLKPSQLPLLNPVMDTMVMDMDMAMVTDTATATTDTMERDLQKPNPVMDMATDAMDTMARGLLNLSMDTMAMDMVMVMV